MATCGFVVMQFESKIKEALLHDIYILYGNSFWLILDFSQ